MGAGENVGLKDVKYKREQTILKVYGYGEHKKIKVLKLRYLRTAGISDENEFKPAKCTINDEKLAENIARAKSKIFELAFCNPWQYFFTATLSPEKYNRMDLSKFHKDITQFLRDTGKKYGTKIAFLLIPELHEDGKSWHMHGFLHGVPEKELQQFVIGNKMGKVLAEKVKNGEKVYNWLSYQKKFGYCSLEPVRNHEAVSKYVTKYINKNLAKSVKELNAHLYYHSRGLNTAETIKKGTMLADIVPDYENEYCSIKWFDYDEQLLKQLKENLISIDYYKTRKPLRSMKTVDVTEM